MSLNLHFLPVGADVSCALETSYNLALVGLSVLSSSVAAFAALRVLERMAQADTPRRRLAWLAVGSLAMGSGIWTMHFVGMLAFELPATVLYELGITFASIIPAVLASGIALLVMNREQIGFWRLNGGGLMMGVAIGVMHYAGMTAMVSDASMMFDPVLFALSIVVAHVLATLALFVKFAGRHRQYFSPGANDALSASIMGIAVAGMHYTGMAAAYYFPGGLGLATEDTSTLASAEALGVPAAMGAVFVLCAAIVMALVDRRMQRASANLELTEARYKSVVEAVVDAIVTVDAQGVIRSFNAAAARIFGYEVAEALGRNIRLLTGTDGAADPWPELLRRAADRQPQRGRRELDARHRSGRPVSIDVAVNPMHGGEEPLFSVICRDLSSQREVDRMKREFVSTVSHELRTPLTSIRGSLGLLEGGACGELPDKALDMLRLANRNAERLIKLINELLDMERLETGKLDLHIERVDSDPLVARAVAEIDGMASDAGVGLRLMPGAGCRIDADPDRFVQILTNMLSNAIKFAPAGTEVTVRSAVLDRCLRISVSDRGPGIPAESRAEVFEKFRQVDGTSSRKVGGSGLGLAICRSLVKQHGGRIGLDSEVGNGTTFWFELPLPGAGEQPLTPPTRAAAAGAG